MVKLLLAAVALLILGAFGAAAGALYLNHLPWDQPPGFGTRLQVYLTSHTARTSPTSLFPELRPRRYPMPPQKLESLVRDAMRGLGWTISVENAGRRMIGAVVTTPLLRFKDDISVTISRDGNGSLVQAESRSRVGKADFGANTRHIMNFYAALDAIAKP
jgi:uncharacterized protein (DUF1499 family)